MSQTTKRAIEASLKHLLLKKPLDKITINDIAEDCGISRMTFYYHFQDIYDLVEWSCIQDAEEVLQGHKTSNTWEEGLYALFGAILDNKPFVTNVYRSVSREHVETYLYRIVYKLLKDVVDEQAVGMNVREDDKEFLANLYKYSFVGLTLEWINNDMRQDPELIIRKLDKAIKGNIKAALKRYETF